jgi:hypothetical protein
MRVRSRKLLAGTAVSALAIAAAGAALAQSQDGTTGATTTESTAAAKAATLSPDAYLDSLAEELGVTRAELDAALLDIQADELDWAVGAGFLTQAQADAMKALAEANAEAAASGAGRPGLGFGRHGLGHGPGFGHFGKLGGGVALDAAADYLGLDDDELRDALAEKTLAEVATEQGKPLDGLEDALLSAADERLDGAVDDGLLTEAQAAALLDRLVGTLGDVLNGRSPAISALAERLAVDAEKVEQAMKSAAKAQVDAALAAGLLTQAQADAIKERIDAGRALGLGPVFGFRGAHGGGHHGYGGFGPGGGMGGAPDAGVAPADAGGLAAPAFTL